MAGFVTANVRAIGLKQVQAKLVAAAPNILAHNRRLVMSMLEFVEAEVKPQMPLGPGHFAVHARESYRKVVYSRSTQTFGKLYAAVQAFWREFGTLGRYRKGGKATAGMSRAASYAVTVGTGGERPRPITRHALAGARKFIEFYYGGMANWWKV